jgi:very-short-patch-repair endonuclease
MEQCDKTKEFIHKASLIHGDKYDYSKVQYKKAIEKVIIICKTHGDFKLTPNKHLSRADGCKICGRELIGDKLRKTTEDFVKEAKLKHVDENGVPIYHYEKVDYKNMGTKVSIICKKHGIFNQTPGNHLYGYGCKKCRNDNSGSSQRLTKEQFIEKAKLKHIDENSFPLYSYEKVIYTNSHTDVIITCKLHDDFTQRPNNHLNGMKCPLCKQKTEAKLYDKLLPIYPSLVSQFKQEWCKNLRHLPFDFCIPEHKIIIELDGRQHFQQVSNWSSPEEQFENDKYKEKCANDNKYSAIRILQDDVLNDTYDWCKELCDAIEEIKNGDEIVNIYLCKNGEYDAF